MSEIKFPITMYRQSGEGRIVNVRANPNAMELVEVTYGRVSAQIGTEVTEASSCDIFFITTEMIFRLEAVEGSATVRGVIFDTSIIEENMENFDTELLYMFYVQSRNKATVFEEGHPVHASLARLIEDAYLEYSLKDVCYKLPIRAGIYFMVTALLRYYCGSKDEQDRIVYHNVMRLRPVITYISENFKDKIYIEKLADMINVSPDYFTKMFKDSIGKTPIEYINGLRVNYSMRLLATTDMSMAEIAEDIGFCNPNDVHKIFKQYMGVSPLQYRKSTK
ncbi:MAG: helix-turn-helix transcriptional regulator [Clostridia bacterium]|nr:helix-turn-helix transcriptional regulator [Clostridia bacterium]